MIKMFNIKAMCDKYKINVKGVVQVGTHKGQETGQFLSMSPNKIILIEANPHFVEILRNGFEGKQSIIKIVGCAITNYNGRVKLNVLSNDGLSSSLLPLKIHSKIYPHIIKVKEIEVDCKRLDTLLEEMGEDPADYNFLNVDVQGAEHLVLEGAMDLLKHIEAINTEINCVELYEGCVLETDLTSFLDKNGFDKKEETKPYHRHWGDAFYVKR